MLFKFIVLFVVLLNIQQGASKTTKRVGQFEPVDLNNPTVQRLAHDAVAIHNKKRGQNLKFHQVLTAEKELMAGVIYNITLEARNPIYYPEHFQRLQDLVYVSHAGKETHHVHV